MIKNLNLKFIAISMILICLYKSQPGTAILTITEKELCDIFAWKYLQYLSKKYNGNKINIKNNLIIENIDRIIGCSQDESYKDILTNVKNAFDK